MGRLCIAYTNLSPVLAKTNRAAWRLRASIHEQGTIKPPPNESMMDVNQIIPDGNISCSGRPRRWRTAPATLESDKLIRVFKCEALIGVLRLVVHLM